MHMTRVRGAMAVAALVTLGATRPASAQTIAITGGKVYPVSSAPIDGGTVLIRDGKIVAVGKNVAIPSDATRIDATGKIVTPGFVNPATELGVQEIAAVSDTRDFAARGRSEIAASFHVIDGLNPRSALIAPARDDGGVTSVVVLPLGGMISGQAAAIDLVNGTASDMILRDPIAMVGEVGDAQAAGTSARGELLGRLRDLLDDTKAYMQRKADYERNQTREFSAGRSDLEAMIPVVQGRLPVLIQVDRASDIESALRLARQYGLKIIIGGGAEAWEVADELAAAHVPVLAGAMNNIPSSFETLGQRQENAGLLAKAGVSVALIGNAGGGDEEAFNVRNIKNEAGNAVAYGMSWDDALRAVTLAPAEIFGVADRVGSLQPGREANVVIWPGDPFEFSSYPEHVLVRGQELRTPSRQDMLMERYRTLPPDYFRP